MKKVSIFGVSLLTMIALATVLFYNSCTDDPCKDVVCVNGECVDGTCACDAGYEGTDCSTEQRAKFIGVYSVTGTVTCPVTGGGTIPTSTLNISNSSSDVSKIVIDFAGALTVIGTVTGTSLTIESQLVSGFTYTGSGSINGNNITLAINEFDGTIPETCVYNLTGPKQ